VLSLGTGFLIDRPSRPISIGLVFLSGIIVCAALSVAPATFGVSLVLGSLAGGTIAAAQSVVYGLAPASYPLHVRGTGVGFAVALGRSGAALGPLLAGAILGTGAGPATVLGVLVPMVILAGICSLYVDRVTRPVRPLAGQPEPVPA
jgi:AAHS family 3-hydroxyphenylpropionic acid transporter